LAVADGVGGWNNRGIDPSKYSRELCRQYELIYFSIQKYCELNMNDSILNPKILLTKSAEDTKAIGSSTLSIITLDKNIPMLKNA
jgi:protein phosphatase PTC7